MGRAACHRPSDGSSVVPCAPAAEGQTDSARDSAERAWEAAEHEGSDNPAYDGATDEALYHEVRACRLRRLAESPPSRDLPAYAPGQRYADRLLADEGVPDDLAEQHRAWLRATIAEAYLDGIDAAGITDLAGRDGRG